MPLVINGLWGGSGLHTYMHIHTHIHTQTHTHTHTHAHTHVSMKGFQETRCMLADQHVLS